jgi:16S rRNA (adenine1518-N6/adenine1519-N6)-dimethyltransferase
MVKAKKHLGQHFLRDTNAAAGVADSLTGFGNYQRILEVGPGTGVLTQLLLDKQQWEVNVVEIDRESVAYLKVHFPLLGEHLIEGDFLKMDLREVMGDCFALTGNYPYHISSQILFKALDYRDHIPEITGMFQKEVAERACAGPGSKTYGILGILLQVWYDAEYLFTVEAEAFDPPPKVRSGVIRLQRNQRTELPCDEALFKSVVKTAFNQRRKKLSNTLKQFPGYDRIEREGAIWDLRPEQISIEQFIELAVQFEAVSKDL